MIRSGDAPNPCQKSSGKWVLAATILGSSLAFIDGTVVNVALPALQKDLQATVIGVQWVIEAYSLLLAALLLVGGSLGDRYGRRRIFVIGVMIFAVASAACGFAGGIGTLIAARALQGIWFQEASPLSAIPSPKRTAAGPSERGPASARSRLLSGRSWEDGWWKPSRGERSSS